MRSGEVEVFVHVRGWLHMNAMQVCAVLWERLLNVASQGMDQPLSVMDQLSCVGQACKA